MKKKIISILIALILILCVYRFRERVFALMPIKILNFDFNLILLAVISLLASLGAVVGIRYLDRDKTAIFPFKPSMKGVDSISSKAFVISDIAAEGEDETYSQLVSTVFESNPANYHLCLLLCEVTNVLSIEKIAKMITSNLITKGGRTTLEIIDEALKHFSSKLPTIIKGKSSMNRWGLGILISDSKKVYWGIIGNLMVFSVKGSSIKKLRAESTPQTYTLRPREPFFLASHEFRKKEIRDIVEGVYKQFEDPAQHHIEIWKTLEHKRHDYPKMSLIYISLN